MGLIDDDHRIHKVEGKVLSDLLVDQIVVWHKYQVCALHSVLDRIVWTVSMPQGLNMDLFYVTRIPGHAGPRSLSVRKVHARIYSLLHGAACGIEREALIRIDSLLDAEMVARCYKHRARLKSSAFELFLDLGELRVRAACVDDLRHVRGVHSLFVPLEIFLALSPEPRKRRAKQRKCLTRAGRTLKKRVLLASYRLDYFTHVFCLAFIRTEGKVNDAPAKLLRVLTSYHLFRLH